MRLLCVGVRGQTGDVAFANSLHSMPQRVAAGGASVARGGWRGRKRFVGGRCCLCGSLDYVGFDLILIGALHVTLILLGHVV